MAALGDVERTKVPHLIRAAITDDEARALATAPERGLRSVSWLASQIIRQWLGDPHRRLSPEPPPAKRNPTSLAVEVARRRERVLQKWHRYMNSKGRSKRSAVATEAFLRRLPPEDRVCRSTLYGWERRYKAHGLTGLIDGRFAGSSSPPAA